MLHLDKLEAFKDRDRVIYNSFLYSSSAEYFPRVEEMVSVIQWKEHVGLHLRFT